MVETNGLRSQSSLDSRALEELEDEAVEAEGPRSQSSLDSLQGKGVEKEAKSTKEGAVPPARQHKGSDAVREPSAESKRSRSGSEDRNSGSGATMKAPASANVRLTSFLPAPKSGSRPICRRHKSSCLHTLFGTTGTRLGFYNKKYWHHDRETISP